MNTNKESRNVNVCACVRASVCECIYGGGGVCVCVLMCRICSGVGGSIQDYTPFPTSDYDAALSKSSSCVQLGPSVNRCGL